MLILTCDRLSVHLLSVHRCNALIFPLLKHMKRFTLTFNDQIFKIQYLSGLTVQLFTLFIHHKRLIASLFRKFLFEFILTIEITQTKTLVEFNLMSLITHRSLSLFCTMWKVRFCYTCDSRLFFQLFMWKNLLLAHTNSVLPYWNYKQHCLCIAESFLILMHWRIRWPIKTKTLSLNTHKTSIWMGVLKQTAAAAIVHCVVCKYVFKVCSSLTEIVSHTNLWKHNTSFEFFGLVWFSSVLFGLPMDKIHPRKKPLVVIKMQI